MNLFLRLIESANAEPCLDPPLPADPLVLQKLYDAMLREHHENPIYHRALDRLAKKLRESRNTPPVT